ncbi:divergent polysaccharide deacetylase family protein [Pseudoroseomonas sp. WGS1072]|uniref:divergent polysaccharide deacetylase family protein n=1 Tax=Roseomonas sp. WGS1072 TaxID=3366816 RepID=UPI003BF090E5
MSGHARRPAFRTGMGWRALGVFWALVATAAATTALTLHLLGPAEPAPPRQDRREPVAPAQGAPAPAVPEPAPAPVPSPPEAAKAPSPPHPLPHPPPHPPPFGETVSELAVAPPAPPGLPEAPSPPPLPPRDGRGGAAAPIPPPLEDLLETGPAGAIPRRAGDGREAREVYARPFLAGETRPRIALVIGMGFVAERAEAALHRLPAEVTPAFSPRLPRARALQSLARQRGMEMLLALPLDSLGMPLAPDLLRASLSPAENRERLLRALGAIGGYAGAIGATGGWRGERFAAEAAPLEALQDSLAERGLYYVEARPGAPEPAAAWGASVDLVLDEPLTRGEVDRRLALLEALARRRGHALGLAAEPAPLLVDAIAGWAAGLAARDLVLAPVSALTYPPGSYPPGSTPASRGTD